jgi:hypothetical protein
VTELEQKKFALSPYGSLNRRQVNKSGLGRLFLQHTKGHSSYEQKFREELLGFASRDLGGRHRPYRCTGPTGPRYRGADNANANANGSGAGSDDAGKL